MEEVVVNSEIGLNARSEITSPTSNSTSNSTASARVIQRVHRAINLARRELENEDNNNLLSSVRESFRYNNHG